MKDFYCPFQRASTQSTAVSTSNAGITASSFPPPSALTTQGSRFVISQMQSSPVRVNNWALHVNDSAAETTARGGAENSSSSGLPGSKIHSQSTVSNSARCSRDSSPSPLTLNSTKSNPPINAMSNPQDEEGPKLMETSFFNPRSAINIQQPSSSATNSPLEFSKPNYGCSPSQQSQLPVQSPMLPRNRGCYYRLVANSVLEVFYPDTNQIFRYKFGAAESLGDSSDESYSRIRHMGPPDLTGLQGRPGEPTEWRPFGVPNQSTMASAIRPSYLTRPANQLAQNTQMHRNSPQWMSKLVDKRSSADAEFHTRFPFPQAPTTMTNFKSPSRKKATWISNTTSTINSVFGKQS